MAAKGIGFLLLILGLALAGTGAYLGFFLKVKKQEECTTGCCKGKVFPVYRDGSGDVCMGLDAGGLVGMILGGILFIIGIALMVKS